MVSRKLSLSFAIKSANDVHGHYDFGGDEEWHDLSLQNASELIQLHEAKDVAS